MTKDKPNFAQYRDSKSLLARAAYYAVSASWSNPADFDQAQKDADGLLALAALEVALEAEPTALEPLAEVGAIARMKPGQRVIPDDEMWRIRYDSPFSLPVGEIWLPVTITITEGHHEA